MPRPDATAAFIAAIESSYVKPALLVQVGFTTGTVYAWSGVGSLSWNGNTYAGVGQFGGISTVEEGTDLRARGIVLSLSGIDATLLGDTLNDYRQGLPVVVYLAVFDASGNIVPNPVTVFSGRTDQPTITISGRTATIEIAAESRLIEMNVAVQRRYTDQDQKLDYPNDRAFEFVFAIQNLTSYWGRHPSSNNNWTVQGHG